VETNRFDKFLKQVTTFLEVEYQSQVWVTLCVEMSGHTVRIRNPSVLKEADLLGKIHIQEERVGSVKTKTQAFRVSQSIKLVWSILPQELSFSGGQRIIHLCSLLIR
jgi:hypothetical protein